MPRLDRRPNPFDDPLRAIHTPRLGRKFMHVDDRLFRLGKHHEPQPHLLAGHQVLDQLTVKAFSLAAPSIFRTEAAKISRLVDFLVLGRAGRAIRRLLFRRVAAPVVRDWTRRDQTREHLRIAKLHSMGCEQVMRPRPPTGDGEKRQTQMQPSTPRRSRAAGTCLCGRFDQHQRVRGKTAVFQDEAVVAVQSPQIAAVLPICREMGRIVIRDEIKWSMHHQNAARAQILRHLRDEGGRIG